MDWRNEGQYARGFLGSLGGDILRGLQAPFLLRRRLIERPAISAAQSAYDAASEFGSGLVNDPAAPVMVQQPQTEPGGAPSGRPRIDAAAPAGQSPPRSPFPVPVVPAGTRRALTPAERAEMGRRDKWAEDNADLANAVQNPEDDLGFVGRRGYEVPPVLPPAPDLPTIKVTVGGQTYDYSKGERAPQVPKYEPAAAPPGETRTAFGQTYTPVSGRGTISFMGGDATDETPAGMNPEYGPVAREALRERRGEELSMAQLEQALRDPFGMEAKRALADLDVEMRGRVAEGQETAKRRTAEETRGSYLAQAADIERNAAAARERAARALSGPALEERKAEIESLRQRLLEQLNATFGRLTVSQRLGEDAT